MKILLLLVGDYSPAFAVELERTFSRLAGPFIESSALSVGRNVNMKARSRSILVWVFH